MSEVTRILIARARRKSRQRRGSGAEHLDVEDLEIASPAPDDQLLALNDAHACDRGWTTASRFAVRCFSRSTTFQVTTARGG